jgi:hypothetical protein
MQVLRKLVAFTKEEHKLLRSLKNPSKIQDYLDTLKINFDHGHDTLRSPREVIKIKKAHCMEAAMLAGVALWYHGHPPLLLDLVPDKSDYDHVVALFKKDGYWGAISKTNHSVLRYREPIYRSVRELAMSYFHEYFLNNGRKTLRTYSKPFDLSNYSKKFGYDWITSRDNIWDLETALDESPHIKILSTSMQKNLRRADPTEILAGKVTEYLPAQAGKK